MAAAAYLLMHNRMVSSAQMYLWFSIDTQNLTAHTSINAKASTSFASQRMWSSVGCTTGVVQIHSSPIRIILKPFHHPHRTPISQTGEWIYIRQTMLYSGSSTNAPFTDSNHSKASLRMSIIRNISSCKSPNLRSHASLPSQDCTSYIAQVHFSCILVPILPIII